MSKRARKPAGGSAEPNPFDVMRFTRMTASGCRSKSNKVDEVDASIARGGLASNLPKVRGHTRARARGGIRKASRAHLAECNESYLAHLRAALGITLTLGGAALACAVHAFVPAFFTRTASTRVEQVGASIRARKTAGTMKAGEEEARLLHPTA